jgi:hypothetical protein
MIRRHTADNIRVTFDNGILYLGFDGLNRKPLTPSQIALLAEVVALCDAAEVKRAIDLARKLDTPGAILAALEGKPNTPPRRPKRGDVRSVYQSPSAGYIVVERW